MFKAVRRFLGSFTADHKNNSSPSCGQMDQILEIFWFRRL